LVIALGAHLHVLGADTGNGTRESLALVDLSALVKDVEIVAYRTYVATADNRLAILDMTNPHSPALAGVYLTQGTLLDMAPRQDVVYLLIEDHGSSDILAVDVADAARPREAARFTGLRPLTLHSLTEANGYLYVAAGDAGVVTLDFTDPQTPVVVSVLEESPSAVLLSSYGDRLVSKGTEVDGTDGFQSVLGYYDIATRGKPKLMAIQRLDREKDISATSMALDGDRLVLRDANSLEIIDVHDVSAPTVEVITVLSSAPVLTGDVVCRSDRVYTAVGARSIADQSFEGRRCTGDGYLGVKLSDAGSVDEVESWSTGFPGRTFLVVASETSLIAGDRCGVYIRGLKVSDGSEEYVSLVGEPKLAVDLGHDRIGIVDYQYYFQVYDVSDRARPVRGGRGKILVDAESDMRVVATWGGLLFAGTTNGRVHAFNVRETQDVQLVGTVELSGQPVVTGMDVSDGYVFAVGTDRASGRTRYGMWVVAVGGRAALQEIAFVTTPYRPMAVAVERDIAFVAARTDDPAEGGAPTGLMWVVDVADPEQPRLVRRITHDLGSAASRVGWSIRAVEGDVAVTSMEESVRFVRGAASATAGVSDEAVLPDQARAVDSAARRLFVAAERAGVAIDEQWLGRPEAVAAFVPLVLQRR